MASCRCRRMQAPLHLQLSVHVESRLWPQAASGQFLSLGPSVVGKQWDMGRGGRGSQPYSRRPLGASPALLWLLS